MAARTGMTVLITQLRELADVGSTEDTDSGGERWTDDQLQALLDRRSTEIRFRELTPIADYAGGAVIYKDYPLPVQWVERSLSVLDVQGNAVGTALYTVDYDAGLVRFTDNTGGSAVYISGRSFDFYRAAADVWRRKASLIASSAYSWSTDNMRIDKSGLRAEYLAQARECERLAGPTMVEIHRGDE